MENLKLLISPQQVYELAFAGAHEMDRSVITESIIVSAQNKFIRPVVNGLYENLQNGKYPELLKAFVKPALAQYVKHSVLNLLAVNVTPAGIVKVNTGFFDPISKEEIGILKKHSLNCGLSLLKEMSINIENNAEKYPEYDKTKNIINRISISSGFIL